jgi:hypothetical protein
MQNGLFNYTIEGGAPKLPVRVVNNRKKCLSADTSRENPARYNKKYIKRDHGQSEREGVGVNSQER